MTAWWPHPITAREEVGATGGSAGDEAGWLVSCRNQLAATSPVLGPQAMAHHTRLYLPRALGIELNVLLQARQALYQPSCPSSPKLYFFNVWGKYYFFWSRESAGLLSRFRRMCVRT